MKKIVSVLFVTVMCCVMIVGCSGNNNVPKLPHNNDISLTDSQENIIKKDELKELTPDNNAYEYLSQISPDYENSEEYGKQYVKDENSTVTIEGYEFYMSYVLNSDNGLMSVRYRGSNIDSSGYDELSNVLIDNYGEPIKNAEFAFYDKYKEWKVEIDNEEYIVEMGIPTNFQDELWIQIGRNTKK
ncbi:hypothetical protein [[Clostridium] scindens]|uniref:hypothetical protein n=1 Tax=Clostridium scindens (strain JCM 10418 / VPI 12708) TaxID=29347 RepID=UPI0024317752|nr:hypothetical protein [[Clostridium] scindens]